MNRVAITGLGVMSSLGNTPEQFFSSLLSGKSGVRLLDKPFPKELNSPLGASVVFDPEQHFAKGKLLYLDRFTQLAMVAARTAWTGAGLDHHAYDPGRIGVTWGAGFGGADTIETSYYQEYFLRTGRVKPYAVFMTMGNAPSAHISMEYGLRGPTVTYCVACASSAIAIGEAYRLIKHGYADAVVAGGSEALLTYGTLKAWEGLRALAVPDSSNPGASCKPFDRRRTGLVLAEGAGAVILENFAMAEKRGAPILGEVVGYGSSTDATHITAPDRDGQVRAMRHALDDAGLSPGDVQHINAHGTATVVGDKTETQAIKEVFGSHARSIKISSTKSMHGHVMGATGAIEFVATVLAARHQAVPPTAHLEEPDPECDLDYVPRTACHDFPIRYAMTNSFAFGGSNAVLIVRRCQ